MIADDIATPTLTLRALGTALFEFNLRVVAYKAGQCPSTKVDEGAARVEKLVERVREIGREVRQVAEAAFRDSCESPEFKRAKRRIGVKEFAGVRPVGLSGQAHMHNKGTDRLLRDIGVAPKSLRSIENGLSGSSYPRRELHESEP